MFNKLDLFILKVHSEDRLLVELLDEGSVYILQYFDRIVDKECASFYIIMKSFIPEASFCYWKLYQFFSILTGFSCSDLHVSYIIKQVQYIQKCMDKALLEIDFDLIAKIRSGELEIDI